MGWRLAISIGGFLTTWFGSIPVSKTYYSDHVHVKYIPGIMFVDDEGKESEYLRSIRHARDDHYPRELYSRNYRRWLWRKPLCTVVGDKLESRNLSQPSLESEDSVK